MAKPISPTERAVTWRKARLEEGYQQKAFLLSPAALAAIEKIKKREGLRADLDAVELALAETARVGKGKR